MKPEVPTLAEAVKKFLDYARSRNRGWETMRKYENLLERRFLPWCESKGYRQLKQIDVDALRTFQTMWKDSPLYATKNVERLRAFFRFCDEAGWTKTNPARALDVPTSKPNPTLPFSAGEMKKILAACDEYRGNKDRVKAFILIMRYSRLRIGDTITLKRDQLQDGKLFLYTQKTGQPVYVPLPKFVDEALGKIKNGPEHFFWSGKKIRSAVSNWSRYLASVYETAKVRDAHSHRFSASRSVDLPVPVWPMTYRCCRRSACCIPKRRRSFRKVVRPMKVRGLSLGEITRPFFGRRVGEERGPSWPNWPHSDSQEDLALCLVNVRDNMAEEAGL